MEHFFYTKLATYDEKDRVTNTYIIITTFSWWLNSFMSLTFFLLNIVDYHGWFFWISSNGGGSLSPAETAGIVFSFLFDVSFILCLICSFGCGVIGVLFIFSVYKGKMKKFRYAWIVFTIFSIVFLLASSFHGIGMVIIYYLGFSRKSTSIGLILLFAQIFNFYLSVTSTFFGYMKFYYEKNSGQPQRIYRENYRISTYSIIISFIHISFIIWAIFSFLNKFYYPTVVGVWFSFLLEFLVFPLLVIALITAVLFGCLGLAGYRRMWLMYVACVFTCISTFFLSISYLIDIISQMGDKNSPSYMTSFSSWWSNYRGSIPVLGLLFTPIYCVFFCIFSIIVIKSFGSTKERPKDEDVLDYDVRDSVTSVTSVSSVGYNLDNVRDSIQSVDGNVRDSVNSAIAENKENLEEDDPNLYVQE